MSFDNMFVTSPLIVRRSEADTLYGHCQTGGAVTVSILCSINFALLNGPGMKSKMSLQIFRRSSTRCFLASSRSVSMVWKRHSAPTICRETDVASLAITLKSTEMVAVATTMFNESRISLFVALLSETCPEFKWKSTTQYGTVTPFDKRVLQTGSNKTFSPQG